MSRRPTFEHAPSGRLRVVTLIDLLGVHGGAERVAFVIATQLDREHFDSTLCVSAWPRQLSARRTADAELEELSAARVRFLPLGRRRKFDLRAWGRLARFLRRERIHVLHTHKFGSNLWGTIVGRIARVPVVLAHEHTWSYEGQPLRRFLDREVIARGSDVFIAVSRADQRRMVEVERIDPEQTLFIPNGVSPRSATGHDVRAELGIGPDAPVIGTVGVLRPQKALDVLLHAVATLVRSWPGIEVLIVGDGSERARLQALAAELGIAQRVRFLGRRTDVPDVLQALDVAVCCSDFEGSPLSVLEYMDAALPVVATTVGGVPDLIEHGLHGMLVPRRDSAALARSIGELLADPERRRQMGLAAQRRRRSEFDVESLVRRLEALYHELLSRPKAARRVRRMEARGG